MKDRRILRLIRRYLQSEVMVNGVRILTKERISQGGALNPLLANILFDDLDKGLEQRGHKFVRYADDCAPRSCTKDEGSPLETDF